MRIVQVAPNIIPLPGSGGIERVVYNLSEELVRRGHEVYLYALAGTHSSAVVIPYGHRFPRYYELEDFVRQTLPDDVDIIHDHTHDLNISEVIPSVPTVSTFHTEWAKYNPARCPVFVSRTKLEQSPHWNRGVFVHNGIDLNRYEFSTRKEDFLLFLGRIDREKGVPAALEVARQTGMRLVIAGPIWDEEHFVQDIVPDMETIPNAEYVGEVHGEEKKKLLKQAKWLLFPSLGEEQFGLVVIEAMASGTPVAAFRRGAVPEILEPFPAFLCDTVEDMARLVRKPSPYSAHSLAMYVRENFSIEVMTDRYLSVYQRAIEGWDR